MNNRNAKIRLTCFLASAFDKKDVDKMYSKIFVPVLRSLSIKPLRVDKVEHNDDIDDKIFDLLDQANICIADLTYARPSVYYEAGYAYGQGKPVIFTTRKDHFKPKTNDPNGLLKVHFDLQMKNIIPWAIGDKTFKGKLTRRIKQVILPILKKKNEAVLLNKQENLFTNLSQIEKRDKIIFLAKKIFENKKYVYAKPEPLKPQKNNSLVYSKYNGLQYVYLFVDPTITKKTLEYMTTFFSPGSGKDKREVRIAHIFFNTFRSIPNSRITEALTEYKQISDKTFFYKKEHGFTKRTLKTYFHFIDRIKSEEDFQARFKNIFDGPLFK